MLTKINPADKNLDFEYFVNLALKNKLPWDSLIVILNDWTPTLAKSKEVIEILVKELQKRQIFEGKIEKVDQTEENVQLVQSQEFEVEIGANEYENQSIQEYFEGDFAILDSDEVQFTEDSQDMNNFHENIDEKFSNEMLDIEYENSENEIETFQMDDSITKSNLKEFQCSVCKAVLNTKFNLMIHERILSGETPFQCKTCNKAFKSNQYLVKHSRSHTGEKPFECKTCFKSFNRRATLMNHQKFHSGEKPFPCKTCSKRFTMKGDLKRHEEAHIRRGKKLILPLGVSSSNFIQKIA